MNRRHHDPLHILFLFLGGVVLLFIIAPIVSMFINTGGAQVRSLAHDKEVLDSIVLTLWTSMLATVIFALFSIPLAYILARKQFPGKGIVKGIINLPVVIPHSAAGIALLGILSRDSLMGRAAGIFGFGFISEPAGIMMAMAYVSLPFLIISAIDGFESIPERLEKAALNLGASPARVFFTISLPLAWKSILSGFMLMWARGMSEFGAVVFIAYHPMITPVMIFERFGAFGLKYARPIATVFVAVCLMLFVLVRFLSKERKRVRY